MTSPVALGLVVIATLALGAVVLAARSADQRRRDGDRRVFRLDFPSAFEAEAVVNFVRALASQGQRPQLLDGRSTVVFELVATSGQIEHRLRVPERQVDAVLGQLRAAIPAIGVEALGPEEAAIAPSAGAELRLTDDRRPLRTDQPEPTAAVILATLQPLQAGEAVVMQWVAAPTRHHRARAETLGKGSRTTASVLDLVR